MIFMKNKIFLLLMSTMLVVSLSGCGNKPIESPPSPANPTESTVEAPVETSYRTVAIQTHMCKENADYVIKSQEEFDNFVSQYESLNDYEDFTNAFNIYKGYFIDNTLLVHVELTGSGSDTFEITDVNVDEGKITVENTTSTGSVGTCDMSTWFFFAEIPEQVIEAPVEN